MAKHILTGFGFGPIQAGLFAAEALQSSNFSKIVVAEIDSKLVDAVKANSGTYFVNVARADGIDVIRIDNIRLLNPTDENDRKILLEALSESTEIVTSLPSVDSYSAGQNSVASLIVAGLNNSKAPATIIYAAENNNQAAEILRLEVIKKATSPLKKNTQFLNTVIGKMSRVVTDTEEITQMKLTPVAPGINHAFLVEEFNKILVTRCTIQNFTPGIEVFIEKDDLLPFEEAKLYGHNAIHALLAYLGMVKGYKKMTELKDDKELMKIATDAFIKESGAALIKKYTALDDELFTQSGYKYYAEDLLKRMTNPYLEDTTERAGRDVVRKLGCNDRIFGTIRLALQYGIEPVNMAIGAAAGIYQLLSVPAENNLPKTLQFDNISTPSCEQIKKILTWLWQGKELSEIADMATIVSKAIPKLLSLLSESERISN